MVRYRSWGRQTPAGHRNTLGEVAEQNFKPDHDWAKDPTSVKPSERYDRRVAFGMPIGYTNCDIERVKPEGHERRGSPLIAHVHWLGDEYVAIATMLPADLVPSGKTLKLEMKKGRTGAVIAAPEMAAFQENAAWDVLTGFINGISKTTGQAYFNQRQIWP
jgi:CRISPR-associated protein Cmr1